MAHVVQLVARDLADDPRAFRAARAAADAGHDVTALCALPPGVEPKPVAGVDVRAVEGGGWSAGVRTAGAARRVPKLPAARAGWRIARQVRWGRRAAGARPAGVGLVHAHDLETLPAGLRLAGGAPLVYDAHELYADELPDLPGLYRRWCRTVEGKAARSGASVVTVSESIAAVLHARLGVRPTVVLNVPLDEPREPSPSGSRPQAIYQGMLLPGRGLDVLVRAAALVPDVEMTIRGLGPLEPGLRELAGDGVRFAEPAAPDAMVEGLAGFDIGIVPYQPTSLNNELCLPNKLFEYLTAGLAVAASDLPELGRVVRETGAGRTFDPGDAGSVATALRELAEPAVLAESRRRAHEAATGPYSWGRQRDVLLGLYESLLSARRPSAA